MWSCPGSEPRAATLEGRGEEARPAGREECSEAESGGGLVRYFPPWVGLLRLHFPSSFISEMKERHMGRESEEHPEIAISLHLKERRQKEVGSGGEKGRVETGTRTQPLGPPRPPPQHKQTRTFFSNVIFPLILGSVSPCVWLSSCPANRLASHPLCIFSW